MRPQWILYAENTVCIVGYAAYKKMHMQNLQQMHTPGP